MGGEGAREWECGREGECERGRECESGREGGRESESQADGRPTVEVHYSEMTKKDRKILLHQQRGKTDSQVKEE